MILLKKNIKFLNHKKINKYRCMIKTKSCENNHNIIYDYVNIYSEFICQKKTSCIENMVIPDISTQINIVKNIFNIENLLDHNTHNLEGIFMKLMLNEDYETLKILLYKLDLYNSIHIDIKEIVENVENINLNENLVEL